MKPVAPKKILGITVFRGIEYSKELSCKGYLLIPPFKEMVIPQLQIQQYYSDIEGVRVMDYPIIIKLPEVSWYWVRWYDSNKKKNTFAR